MSMSQVFVKGKPHYHLDNDVIVYFCFPTLGVAVRPGDYLLLDNYEDNQGVSCWDDDDKDNQGMSLPPSPIHLTETVKNIMGKIVTKNSA